jgi:hypothetical protein
MRQNGIDGFFQFLQIVERWKEKTDRHGIHA